MVVVVVAVVGVVIVIVVAVVAVPIIVIVNGTELSDSQRIHFFGDGSTKKQKLVLLYREVKEDVVRHVPAMHTFMMMMMMVVVVRMMMIMIPCMVPLTAIRTPSALAALCILISLTRFLSH